MIIVLKCCAGFCCISMQISHIYIYMGFPHSSAGKESACSAGDLGLISGLRRFPGGGHGNPLQFLPGESHGQRSLTGYSSWGRKSWT